MKKIISAIILMSMLCSCSSVSQNEPETSRALTVTEEATETAAATTTTEPITEAATTATEIPPAPDPTEPTEPEVNELLFERNGLKIFYQGVEQNIVKFGVENYSTEAKIPIHIFLNNISVNGEQLVGEMGIENYIECETSETLFYNLSLEDLQSRNITRINELDFSFYMQAGDWWVQTEQFTISR